MLPLKYIFNISRFSSVLLFALFTVSIVKADHPGGKIDQYMEEQEKYFQALNIKEAPKFSLVDMNGRKVSLTDFNDKVVVLNFIFASCIDSCPIHSAVIADIQKKINITPMKDNVQFISITTDPATDMPEVLKEYGGKFGLDPANWIILTVSPESAETATRELASAYNVEFEPMGDGQQMHAAVTHIIDRNGRFAGKFHGLEFNSLNVVLYVNGLINNWFAREDHHEKGIWETITDFLFSKES